MSDTCYYKHITAKRKWYNINLKEVWKYKDLIMLFVKKEFIIFYKQTILGPAWIFLNPLITSIFYLIVFGNIAKLGTDGIPELLFYLSGTAIWNFFSVSLVKNSTVFRDNSGIFGKVYFPRLTVFISNVLIAAIQFLIQMILVVILVCFYTYQGVVAPQIQFLWAIPLILLFLGMFAMGVGMIITSMTTKYRDLAMLVSFGISLWMYITPVVYPASTVNNTVIAKLLFLNPVTSIIELFRWCLFGQGMVDLKYIGISCVVTVIVLTIGLISFNKTEKNFMDTI